MAGIALVLDLLRKNPSLTTQSLHASGFFSAKAAASAAAASVAAGAPYVYKSFSNFRVPVAYCDAGATLSDDYLSNLRSASVKIFQNDSLNYSTKEYKFELKPLFSAFELRALTLTTLRSFLMFFLPLLEPRTNLEEDDDDFLQDIEDEQPVDYVVPFKKSLKQIVRELFAQLLPESGSLVPQMNHTDKQLVRASPMALKSGMPKPIFWLC